jgi:copper homeostasis protein
MSIILEVIATSVADAIAAEQGGANRIELVRDLDQGGLTPTLTLVRDVLSAVTIPVRVMVREADTMHVADQPEAARLKRSIEQFSEFPINGLVLGFLRNAQIDEQILARLLPPEVNVTFHRAFDETLDPLSAIAALKRYPQVDRVLTRAGQGSWRDRKAQLDRWQSSASPDIQMLFAVGPDTSCLGQLHHSANVYEVHVGRAARIGQRNAGPVSAEYVAALKDAYAPDHSL